jgi:hypothetical protein
MFERLLSKRRRFNCKKIVDSTFPKHLSRTICPRTFFRNKISAKKRLPKGFIIIKKNN